MDLIGRDRELTDVEQRLGERRLVTIVGPGGIGKTTLARAVLRRVDATSVEIDLTRVTNDDAVAGTIAAQLGHSSFESLLDAPAPGAPVLIDNCEHVISGSATAIVRLLGAAADWQIVATSRSPLDVAGESIIALGPLAQPAVGVADAGAPAVRLFCDRARDAGVDPDPSALEIVGELCRRLDGVPLAIEIAAARTRVLTIAQILEQLRSGMDVLARRRFRGSDRHRSLRATIDWSYRLLDDAARAALVRLAVCAGPFDLDLATAVVTDGESGDRGALDLLETLADASLLVVDTTDLHAPYRLLETIRSFAAEQLEASGHAVEVRERFVAHVVDTVLRMMDEGRAGWTAEVLAQLLAQYDNVAAALSWCVAHDDDATRALLLCSVLWGVVHNGHLDDVAQLGRGVLERWPDPDQPLWADAAAAVSTATLLLGDVPSAVELAERALPYADTSPFAPITLRRVLGLAAQSAGDHERAAEMFAAAADAATAGAVPALAMEAEVFHAQALARRGRHGEALEICRRVHRDADDGGWLVNAVWARVVEGMVLLAADRDRAADCLTDALDRSRTAGYPFGVTASLHAMAYDHLLAGRDHAAAAAVRELLDELGTSTADWSRANPLGPVAVLMHRHGLPGWEDIAATAEAQIVTSPLTAAGLHLVDLPPERGRALTSREAHTVVQRALTSILESPAASDHGANERTVGASIVLDGELWTVTYAGVTAHIKHAKGMADIAELLSRPGLEVHCLDLAGAAVEERSTGEVIDDTARRRYEERIRELQDDIDEAESNGDHARAERAQAEFDRLVDHLTAALGMSGRSRRHVDTAERARSAVTQRIRGTIRRIEAVHPQLGAHLRASVRTGLYCSYRPEVVVAWTTRTRTPTP